jgi:hypothetical protein
MWYGNPYCLPPFHHHQKTTEYHHMKRRLYHHLKWWNFCCRCSEHHQIKKKLEIYILCRGSHPKEDARPKCNSGDGSRRMMNIYFTCIVINWITFMLYIVGAAAAELRLSFRETFEHSNRSDTNTEQRKPMKDNLDARKHDQQDHQGNHTDDNDKRILSKQPLSKS